MRADGAVALAVTAFGLSFILGMQIADMQANSLRSTADVQPAKRNGATLADVHALPGLATVPKPSTAPEPKAVRERHTPKRAVRTARTVRVVVPRAAPVISSTPEPVATPAPRVVATPAPRPVATPRLVQHAPVRTPTPTGSFDDNGQPNTFNDGGGP